MPNATTELFLDDRRATIEPDENGALPTLEELRDMANEYGLDSYVSDAQLSFDRDEAIRASTMGKAKKLVRSRLKMERERLDRQVAELAATDPLDRKVNPLLGKKDNDRLAIAKANTEANIKALEDASDALILSTVQMIKDSMDGQLTQRAAMLASDGLKPEVARLLASLNLNLDLSLNGRQTEQLMSALLTCNENQLNAVLKNQKVPMAVKLMAKRLKDDLKAGSTTALESLWDRIFGKGILDIDGQAANYKRSTMAGSRQQAPQSQTVINLGGTLPRSNGRAIRGEDANRLLHDAALPDRPLSREAYLMIREHFTYADEPQSARVPTVDADCQVVDSDQGQGLSAESDFQKELEELL